MDAGRCSRSAWMGSQCSILGSGAGQDCYVAAQLVGAAGMVVGIDMTEEQLLVAPAST